MKKHPPATMNHSGAFDCGWSVCMMRNGTHGQLEKFPRALGLKKWHSGRMLLSFIVPQRILLDCRDALRRFCGLSDL